MILNFFEIIEGNSTEFLAQPLPTDLESGTSGAKKGFIQKNGIMLLIPTILDANMAPLFLNLTLCLIKEIKVPEIKLFIAITIKLGFANTLCTIKKVKTKHKARNVLEENTTLPKSIFR